MDTVAQWVARGADRRSDTDDHPSCLREAIFSRRESAWFRLPKNRRVQLQYLCIKNLK